MEWLGEFFNIIWSMYSIELPFLNGMTIGSVIIGIFVVILSITLIKRLMQ